MRRNDSSLIGTQQLASAAKDRSAVHRRETGDWACDALVAC